MKNVIFIHVGNLLVDKNGVENKLRCQNILDNIADYIIKSKIYDDVDIINIELIGGQEIIFNVPKSCINYNGDNVQQWEFPTLYKIIKYAKDNPEDNILYIHTKGSSNNVNVPEIKWIEDVRNYHLYQTITRYKECLKLLKDNDVVGAELMSDPVTHFSQNFWWAKAKHINKLRDPNDLPVIYDERHKCEFWIGSNKDSKYKSVHNLYQHWLNSVDFSKELYIIDKQF